MASFDLAWRQGVNGIEFDVQLSSDDVPVVIHDARLTRTTSGSGWVWEHRASVLRRLDAGSWFNRRHRLRARERYAGARIPLLAEVLQWIKARQCLAFVEIKDYRPGAAARILQEIERAGALASGAGGVLRPALASAGKGFQRAGASRTRLLRPPAAGPPCSCARRGRIAAALGDCFPGTHSPRPSPGIASNPVDGELSAAHAAQDSGRCGRTGHQLPGQTYRSFGANREGTDQRMNDEL